MSTFIANTLYQTLTGQPETIALLSEILWGWDDIAATEIRTEDREHITHAETLRVYAQSPETLTSLIDWLRASHWGDQITIGERTMVQQQDWEEAWKRFWHIDPVTAKLTIVPAWESYTPASPDEVVLTLDPGMAFGTGQHATTRLMLQALERLADERDGFIQDNILDVGTGSGILAIYAAKRGSRDILAIDIDPIAIHTTELEAARNHVQLEVSGTPLSGLCQTQYRLILANILAPVVIDLLPEMALRMQPGGVLLASGITESQAPEVIAAMTQAGFIHIRTDTQTHWVVIQAEYCRNTSQHPIG
ncbi:MAG: 50S ribosomal protein L11 methyltransferase [Vampirovibrionales bacterium]|nr:50S ribosomal protein L11 methyltransferase [Vampirovibrionales bacterium]